MRLTDTHCHLDLHQFDADRAAVLQRAAQAGVEKILIPALDLESSRAVLALALTSPMLYAAVGFHPTDAEKWEPQSAAKLRELARSDPNNVAAIGEIGLDYYWVGEPEKRLRQREVLALQLHLAAELELPAVIHLREEKDAWEGEASNDLLCILSDWHKELVEAASPLAARPGVLHSFNGTLETARQALAMNFCIGATGPVTYKNAGMKRHIVGDLPLEALLIETDAPYLTPVPQRGKRNEPAYVAYIADTIAAIHSKNPAEIADITAANASRLFAWGE